MRLFFRALLGLDLLLLLYLSAMGDYIGILNTQVALISSLAVVGGSFYGYGTLVKKKSSDFVYERDELDKIEDPYDLYGDEDTKKDAKELFLEEKRKVSTLKNAAGNFAGSIGGFLSPFRLAGYAVLTLSVLWLMSRGDFEAVKFFIGLSLVPAAALISMLFRR